jgi:PleD family two-component response regulator
VVLPEVQAPAYEYVASAIVDGVRALAIPHGNNAGIGIVTVSVGGARLESAGGFDQPGGTQLGALFRLADERLYRAKQEGRDRACLD